MLIRISIALLALALPASALAAAPDRDSGYGDPYPTDTVRVYDGTGGTGLSAAQAWSAAGITIVAVTNPEEADITIQWGTENSAVLSHTPTRMNFATVTLAQSQTGSQLLAAAVHYVGHALGFKFHSNDRHTVMGRDDHAAPTETAPTSSDLRTMRRIYSEN